MSNNAIIIHEQVSHHFMGLMMGNSKTYFQKLFFATRLFDGNAQKARLWLDLPARSLGNRRPADPDVTVTEVEDLVGQIENGIVI